MIIALAPAGTGAICRGAEAGDAGRAAFAASVYHPRRVAQCFRYRRDPEHAVVACTVGLLRILNQEELEGVPAHELSHVRHRDLLIRAFAATLAHAPAKLEQASEAIPMTNAEPNTSHLFIVNPLRGGGVSSLFSTHPPIAARIARLEEMAKGH